MHRVSILVVVFVALVGISTFAEENCGQRFHDQDFASTKVKPEIVGGKDAVRGAYPWQVSIQMQQSGNKTFHFCGGSIVGHHWIATAAHCINVYMELLPDLFHVVVGDHRRLQDDGSEQTLGIETILKHENYDANTINNDLALIKTKEKIIFGEFVQPVCLPTTQFNYVDGEDSFISGWGSTEKRIPDLGYDGGLQQTRDSPNVLQAAKVPLVNTSECNADHRYNGLVSGNMFCAGYLSGGIDSCQGDSGGPLVVVKPNPGNNQQQRRQFVLIGVTSWGVGCAAPNFPGVYTRVANYADWIQDKIQVHRRGGLLKAGVRFV